MSTPDYLTNVLHGLRHLVFVEKFNVNSPEYVSALNCIACLPLVVFLLLLLWMLIYKMYRIHISWLFSKPCLCLFQCHMNVCACVMFLALCFELMLHHNVLRGLPALKFHETNTIRQFRQDTSENIRATFIGIDAYNRTPHRVSKADFKEVADLYDMYKQMALDVLAAGYNTYKELIDENLVRHSAVKQTLLRYEWCRFVIFTAIWSVTFAVLLMYLCGYCKVTESCAVCGILVFALITSMLLTLAVAIADACHEPWYSLENLRQSNPELNKRMIQAQYSRYCNDTKLEAMRRIKEFLRVFIDSERHMMRWGYIEGARIRTWSSSIDKDYPWEEKGPEARHKYVLALLPLFYKWAYIESLETRIQWRMLTVHCEKDAPRFSEDLTSVCVDDLVLKWMVFQLIMVMIAVASLVMIMHCLSDRSPCLPKYCMKNRNSFMIPPLPPWVPLPKQRPCLKAEDKHITFGQ